MIHDRLKCSNWMSSNAIKHTLKSMLNAECLIVWNFSSLVVECSFGIMISDSVFKWEKGESRTEQQKELLSMW